MTYGENILLKDSASGSANYSFGAILGKDAKLKIVLTNLYIDSSNQIYSIWGYGMGQQGWVITDYNFTENTQSFTSNKDGEIIADFNLGALGLGASGKCKMEFYENSSKITKTKYLKW